MALFRYLLFYVAVLAICLTLILCQDDCSEFSTQPQDVVASAGSMDFMECVYMDPDLSVFWEREGTSIGGDGDQPCNCQVTSDGTLEFNDISADETGDYLCNVQVGFGVSKSCSANLKLAEAPQFSEMMGPGDVASTTRELSAVVSGDPLPDTEWIFNEQVITESEYYTLTSEIIDTGNMKRRETLTINNIQPEHRGVYKLRAMNAAGTLDWQWTVPVFFGNVRISNVDITGTTTELTCTGEYYTEGDSSITWEKGDETVTQTGQITRIDETYQIVFETHLHIEECTGKETVHCTLTYQGAMFEQQNTASQPICDDYECMLPDIRPNDVMCTELSVEVEGRPGQYIIGYLPQGFSTWTEQDINLPSSAPNIITITGLSESTLYYIRITCPSDSITSSFINSTTKSKPPPVTGLYVDIIYNNTGTYAVLTWKSSSANDDVISYIITWYTSDDPDQMSTVEIPATSITQYERSINCDIAYIFKVAATNPCGIGSTSAPVERMCSSVPPPQRVEICQLTSQPIVSDTAALLINFKLNYLNLVQDVEVDVLEQNDNFATVQTLNYTLAKSMYESEVVCVGGLTPDLHYLVCMRVNYSDIGYVTSCVREGKDKGIKNDNTEDIPCQLPYYSEYIYDGQDSEEGPTIPDWGIAVIVVGAILLVAFIFCFLGLCFACQTSQSKNVTFGSMSSINTERGGNVVPSNMHMHNPRTMSPTRSCLKYHRSHGHSTTWNDHVDTLRQMETDKGTHV